MSASIAHRLVLIEGLCGTGKTTLAGRLHRRLLSQGVSARFYEEGALDHPASLNGCAYLSEAEFRALIVEMPDKEGALRAASIAEGGAVLIRYRNASIERDQALQARLKDRELCWTSIPPAMLAEFSRAVAGYWSRFADRFANDPEVIVLEGVFFQHPIHDLVRNYDAADAVIKAHILEVARRIAPLNPVLFYLSHPDVRAQQIEIGRRRQKPHYASEESVQAMERRKQIELDLTVKLPFPAHVVPCDGVDWARSFERIQGGLRIDPRN